MPTRSLSLGGYGEDRYGIGLDLQAQGWASTVVMSHGPDDTKMTDFCATPHPKLQCFVPDPGTTKGEARETAPSGEPYGWRTVIVVTFRPHISRARFILEQCFDGELIMVASPAHITETRWAQTNTVVQRAWRPRSATAAPLGVLSRLQ